MGTSGHGDVDGPLHLEAGAGEDRLVVCADLDLALAGVLQDRAETLLARGGRTLVVDLSQAPFLDSSGVRALVEIARAAQKGSGALRVVADGQPYAVLEMTEVLDLLSVERAGG